MTERVVTELVIDARASAAGAAVHEQAMNRAAAASERAMRLTGGMGQALSREERAWQRLQSAVDNVSKVRFQQEAILRRAAASADDAVLKGLATEQQAAQVIERLRQKQVVDLQRVRDAQQRVTDSRAADARVANDNGLHTGSFSTANIAAQFQDIAVTSAMGMSPLQIALQQGTQLSAVLGGQGLTGVVKSLGSAFASLLSPVSLLTIGVVALGAAGIQAFMGMFSGAKSVREELAAQAAPLESVRSQVDELQRITDTYAKAIRGTAKDQQIATDSIIANSEREFNAKKKLLELELKRQQAAIEVQRTELAAAGRSLRGDVSGATPLVINDVAAGYSDPRIGQFVRPRYQDELLQRTREVIEASPLNDKIKELTANIELAEIATATLEEGLQTTFSDSVATSVDRIASSAQTASEKAAAAYKELIAGGKQFIAAQRLEADALGMTTEAANRLRYEQDLLNKAANDNIALTAGQRAEISSLAEAMAAAGEHTRRWTEAFDFGKDTFRSFFSDLRSELMNGTSLWASFGNAAVGALDRLADRALGMAADGIFDMLFGAIMGSLTGGLGGGIGAGRYAGAGGFFPGLTGPSLLSMDGGGYTGDASRSGGLDGKGGFLAMLHPRETVVDHTRPANQNLSPPQIAITNVMQVMPGATEEDGAAFARGVSKELRRQLPDALEAYQRNPHRRAGG